LITHVIPSLFSPATSVTFAEVSTALLKSVVANFVQQKVPPAEQKARHQTTKWMDGHGKFENLRVPP